jgi:hypothetical protein
MRKILLVSSNRRIDLFNYLLNQDNIEIIILSNEDINKDLNIKQIQFKKYHTPLNIINDINPDIILFLEVYDILQISLCIVANKVGLKTIFLEHGISSNSEEYLAENNEINRKHFNRLIKNLKAINYSIIHRLFFMSSFFYVQNLNSLITLIKIWLTIERKGSLKALSTYPLIERVPSKFLLFGKNNNDHKNLIYHINKYKNINIQYTGNPFVKKIKNGLSNKITIIEHPYFEQSLYNWNFKFHNEKVDFLYKFIRSKPEFDFLIKLHPASDKSLWHKFECPSNAVVKKNNDLNNDNHYEESALILSYSSSMLVDFISNQKNIVLLGWHPVPQIYGVDFSKYGICHTSYLFEDLENNWEHWLKNNLAVVNLTGYERFLEEFNSPFDGLAKQRILMEILND